MNPGRHRELGRRQLPCRPLHEIGPDRQRDARAVRLAADRRRLIETDPHAGDDRRGIADEPRVAIVVGGSGLAGDRPADAQRARRRAGAALDDVAQHAGHLEGDRRADELFAIDRTVEHLAPARVEHRNHPARTSHLPVAGKHRVGRGEIERRDDTGAERERRYVRQVAQARVAGEPEHRARADALLQIDGGGIVRFEQRGAQRERVRLLAFAARTPLRIARRRDVPQVREHRHRRVALCQRGSIDQRLERRTRLPPAADRAVVGAARVAGAADHREDVAGRRIDRHEGRLESRAAQPLESPGDASLGGVLNRRQKCGVHLPVGRVVAAELVAELLAQELLREPGAGVVRLAIRLDLRTDFRARLRPARR